jgi:hypothetical protein
LAVIIACKATPSAKKANYTFHGDSHLMVFVERVPDEAMRSGPERNLVTGAL